jgi:radical SAM protein with 4Fe4S-binding SPASM domain
MAMLLNIARGGGVRSVSKTLVAAYDYWREPRVVKGSPLFLQVEPTILCNLECAFCINPFLPRTRTSLSLDKFKRIVDEVPSVAKISLVGIGESFMNKQLWDIVRYAKSRGIEIGTTSNGTILTDRILGEIIDSGLDFLNFSLDGATKATYEKMRPGAVFEQVLGNIRRIADAARAAGRPPLAIWFLSNRNNITELPMMVPLVKSLGITSLNTQGVHYWGHEDWQAKTHEANAVPELRQVLAATRRAAAEAGVAFQWVNFPDASAERSCKWPWKGSYVTADGYVTPCCENGSDPDKINFGNLFERPYAEIWNSRAYQEFRADLAARDRRPKICAECPSYHAPIRIGG